MAILVKIQIVNQYDEVVQGIKVNYNYKHSCWITGGINKNYSGTTDNNGDVTLTIGNDNWPCGGSGILKVNVPDQSTLNNSYSKTKTIPSSWDNSTHYVPITVNQVTSKGGTTRTGGTSTASLTNFEDDIKKLFDLGGTDTTILLIIIAIIAVLAVLVVIAKVV